MWILPSRGRPHNAQRFFDAYAATGGTTGGVLAVDEDDPELWKYQNRVTLPPGWALEVYPRMWMAPKVNAVFDAHPDEPWYGMVDDDAVPTTPEWDRRLVEAAGTAGIAHCWNGIGNETLASQFVMGGDLARRLGWVLLRGCNRLWCDNAVTDVGRKLGCITYLPDVRLEQWHFSNGKAPMDKIYEKPEAANDRAVYEAWRAGFMNDPVTFVCLKAGTLYGPQYVNILADMVRRNLPAGYPGRFVCITDDPEGLDPAIDVIALPPDLERWWGKLWMFKRGLFPDGTRMAFMDLDTVIVGGLSEILAYKGQFATLRDFGGGNMLGPAVILWEAGEFAASIWEEWDAQGRPRHPRGDQWWMTNLQQGRFPKMIDKLQDVFPGAFVSFKYDCAPMFPKGAKVVCFHGEPRPHNCREEWVQACWKVGGGTAAEMEAVCNTQTEKIAANVRSCLARGLPEVGFVAPHGGQAVIVGGGPSLAGSLNELRWRARNGQTIFACNGAAKYLIEHGITPQHAVILDARPENVAFVTPIHTFLASHCDPSLFDAARSVAVYHANTSGLAEGLEGREAMLISTGSTVGLVAVGIAHVRGFRTFHLYGMDSSYKDEHHAYPQQLNDADAVIEVTAAGRRFKCAPWMLLQAQQFQSLAGQLANEGCTITVAGDGLLPHIAREIGRQYAEAC